jgi:Cell division protein ZapA
MSDLIAINIVIGDRSYRIKIDPKDEETVRRTLKLINDKIIEFKTNFSGKDMQDYVAENHCSACAFVCCRRKAAIGTTTA